MARLPGNGGCARYSPLNRSQPSTPAISYCMNRTRPPSIPLQAPHLSRCPHRNPPANQEGAFGARHAMHSDAPPLLREGAIFVLRSTTVSARQGYLRSRSRQALEQSTVESSTARPLGVAVGVLQTPPLRPHQRTWQCPLGRSVVRMRGGVHKGRDAESTHITRKKEEKNKRHTTTEDERMHVCMHER